jgi:dTDP-4-amino-4,6-dideoxygalactose transaminase
MSLFSPIHHTFAPLGDRAQRMDAVRFSYAVHRYKRGKSTAELKKALQERYGNRAYLFASGREALLALLQSLKLQPEEEVILQGYTCMVLPNAIQTAGMVPVYVDIEKDTLNLSMEALEKALTPKTRVVICQHTFGIPSPTKELRAFCDKHSLILIEDCAHILPDETGPKEIGSFGDFLLLSFGRDKAISGVAGGAVVCRSPGTAMGLEQKEQMAKDLPWWTIAKYLEYPAIYALCRPLYGLWIGKALLALCAKLGLLVPILSKSEKRGHMKHTLHRMPNACAYLALQQLKRLKEINDHRRMLTQFYLEESRKRGWPRLDGITPDLPLQKYPMFLLKAEKIRQKLKKQNIHLYDGWTNCVVCPSSIDIDESSYQKGLDPVAEEVCLQVLSLPTHPNMSLAQARRLCEALEGVLKSI